MDKEKIYLYIDKNGVPFKRMVTMGLNVDLDKGITKNQYPKQFIKIQLPFNLSDEEMNELVLDYIYDLTNFKFQDVYDLLSHKALLNKPFILELNEHSEPKLSIAFKNIPGSLIIRGDKQYRDNGHEILTLGNIETIAGDLGLSNTEIKDLGNLTRIKGDLWFSSTSEFNEKRGFKITTLSPLEKVGGSISIKGSSVVSLGTLKAVGGNLNLRMSKVFDLGKLEYVGGNVLVSRYNLDHYDFSKITIKGKVRKYNDQLKI